MPSDRMWMQPARRLAAVIALAFVAAVSGAFAAAFAPSLTGAQVDGQIQGCVNNFTGDLRVVYSASQCTAQERAISWSQQGSGGIVDIQRAEGVAYVRTGDIISDRAFVEVNCPAGYNVVGGGAGLSFLSGNDRWFMRSSSPRLAGDNGSDGFDGWTASFETLDGEDAEGHYGFFIDAICVLSS